MQEAAVSPLTSWANFYVITGSAAAALTGLMFVVITLIASVRGRQTDSAIATFGTPTVVHLCASLLIAAILSAPWLQIRDASIALGIVGLAGILYGLIILRRTLRQATYKPVLEDWLGHVICPLISYTTLTITAILLPLNPVPVLFFIAAVPLLLLFTGIHNAWDTITFVTIEFAQARTEENERQD